MILSTTKSIQNLSPGSRPKELRNR
jgi:hypothetical protein